MSYSYPSHLETDRLITRKLVYNDYKLWTKFFDEKDCVKYFPTFGLTTSEERAIHWVEKQLKRYQDQEYGLQALILKETGEVIGQSGLLAQHIDEINELEIGYHLFKEHWKKGYALEAATLFKNYAFENNLSESLVSIIHKDNLASQLVAERNGLRKNKEIIFFDTDYIVFRINK